MVSILCENVLPIKNRSLNEFTRVLSTNFVILTGLNLCRNLVHSFLELPILLDLENVRLVLFFIYLLIYFLFFNDS